MSKRCFPDRNTYNNDTASATRSESFHLCLTLANNLGIHNDSLCYTVSSWRKHPKVKIVKTVASIVYI